MAQHSGFASFMAENANVTRWNVLRLQVLFWFFMLSGMLGGLDTIFDHPARILFPLLMSLAVPFAMAAGEYCEERYGRHERVNPLFLSIIVVILVVIVWYGFHRHRNDAMVNGAPAYSNTESKTK